MSQYTKKAGAFWEKIRDEHRTNVEKGDVLIHLSTNKAWLVLEVMKDHYRLINSTENCIRFITSKFLSEYKHIKN